MLNSLRDFREVGYVICSLVVVGLGYVSFAYSIFVSSLSPATDFELR